MRWKKTDMNKQPNKQGQITAKWTQGGDKQLNEIKKTIKTWKENSIKV
jgi:hypothetical protein